LKGDKNWLEEELLVPAKKTKRGSIVEEGSSSTTQDEGGLHIKLINNHMEGSRCHHLIEEYQCPRHIMKCADTSMGEWGSHAATSSIVHGAQRNIHGASSKPTQVKEGINTITLRPRIQSTKIININCRNMKNGGGRRREKIIIMPSTLVRFSLFFIFSFYANLCVRSIFYFYLFSACVLIVVFALNQHE
jgi:hypothetical protein